MDQLQRARAEIDRIDGELARLFEARMAAAAEIAACKQARGLPVRDPAREAEVLARNSARIKDPALRLHFAALLERLMAESRAYQTELLSPQCSEGFTLRTEARDCPVLLQKDALHRLDTLLPQDRRVFLVTDDGIPAEYAGAAAAQCRDCVLWSVPRGEGSKSPAVLTELLSAMLRAGLTRQDCVAALGGKTAVNLDGVKNAAGLFRQPKAVIIDPELLETLPPRQLGNGLAEAVKMALTHDAALFARFEDPTGYGPIEDVIAACLRIKAAVVTADEREAGLRQVLNFGHTLGHGIEAAAEGRLLHGECVGLGMLPMCAPPLRDRLRTVLERLGLPTYVNFELNLDKAMAAISHDKKSVNGGIEIVTVPEIGEFQFQSSSLDELRSLLYDLTKTP